MSLLLTVLDGRITLKGLLGEGGMGEVHRAWDAGLERPVAVKFVRSGDPKEADRLLLEARLQARVEDPHVVRVHEIGLFNGRPCIVMQLVEGHSLSELARSLSVAQKVALIRQAALGLQAAHREGLVHRDMKPGNIMVAEGEDGGLTALVSDFGLARDTEGALTQSGLPPGTLDFMAPEVIIGRPADVRSDVYALGATLYAVLAGRLPFRDTTDTQARPQVSTAAEEPGHLLLHRILEEEPQALRLLVPEVSRDIATIAAKAMEKDSRDRYPSAEDFAEDLGRAERGEPIRARRASAAERSAKWLRRNRMASRILVVAVGLLLVGLAYTIVASRRSGLRALESARMGAEAAAMESALQREFLLPAHDLRPAFQAIRQKMAELAADQSSTEAPRAYALGRGHQLLEEWAEARAQLQRARSLGFRTPEGDLAYGLVLAELYRQGAGQARTIPDPSVRKTRLEALRTELLLPAVAAIQAHAAAMPERTHLLGARVALLEGRFDEAIQQARAAQAAPLAAADALLVEAQARMEQREALYVKHAHEQALEALVQTQRALEQARDIARSDPRVAEALVQCSLLRASHLRSLGTSTTETLGVAKSQLEAAKALHGNEAQLAQLEATLLQRLSLSKKDVGQSGVAEDTAALALLRQAAAQFPLKTDLLRFLANAYYSYCYAKVSAGQDPGDAFAAGYQAVEAALHLSPQDWRLPYTGALLAYPESLSLNKLGLDARAAAHRGVRYAERALDLGAAANAKGIRADCLVELAKAQYAAGEDPQDTIARLLADNEQGVALAPTDQIMRVNAAAAAVQSAHLVRKLGGDVRPLLDKAAQWGEGTNPKYIEAQMNRLDERLLRAEAEVGSPAVRRQTAQAILLDCLAVQKTFKGGLALEVGLAYRFLAQVQLDAGQDPRPAFAGAKAQFLRLEKEDPRSVQAYAESAFTGLAEARGQIQKGQSILATLAEVRAALARSRAVQADQPLLEALEADALVLESQGLPTGRRAGLLQQAQDRWAAALKGNRNLAALPELAPLRRTLSR